MNTIAKWIKAFNCFTAVYSRRWPDEVPGLLKHMEVVIGLTDDNANWLLYDQSFRKLHANGLESFGQINIDLFLSASKGPFRSANSRWGDDKDGSLGRGMCEGVSPPTLPDIVLHSTMERGAWVAHISTGATVVMRTIACPTAKSLNQPPVEKGSTGRGANTPVRSDILSAYLDGYNPGKAAYLINGFSEGFRTAVSLAQSLLSLNTYAMGSHPI